MHGWGVFPNRKRCSMQKNEISVKLIYFIKTSLINRFFSKFLVKFLKNSIKYVALRVVSDALSGAIKVALLRAITIQSAFKNEFAALKLTEKII